LHVFHGLVVGLDDMTLHVVLLHHSMNILHADCGRTVVVFSFRCFELSSLYNNENIVMTYPNIR
jgi:hypothetical protein